MIRCLGWSGSEEDQVGDSRSSDMALEVEGECGGVNVGIWKILCVWCKWDKVCFCVTFFHAWVFGVGRKCLVLTE